jgi:hypothetical protein
MVRLIYRVAVTGRQAPATPQDRWYLLLMSHSRYDRLERRHGLVGLAQVADGRGGHEESADIGASRGDGR